MQFRWYSTINAVTTEMVRDEQARSDDPLMKCKQRLEAKSAPVLQQMHRAGDGSEVWVAVESVIEVKT